jgi:hypothetical protein
VAHETDAPTLVVERDRDPVADPLEFGLQIVPQ